MMRVWLPAHWGTNHQSQPVAAKHQSQPIPIPIKTMDRNTAHVLPTCPTQNENKVEHVSSPKA
jgi:hypothetical protein